MLQVQPKKKRKCSIGLLFLALSLKRFHFDVQLQRPEKIQRHVAFPLQLTVATGVIYHLQAVVIHSGKAGGGHYTAYVRASDGSWYYCDDSATPQRVMNLREILRQQAYMLFYEK